MADRVHDFLTAVGTSLDDCYFVGHRYERDDFNATHESFVVRADRGRLAVLRAEPAWYTGLWRAPSGRLFVADARGRVHSCDAPAEPAPVWTEHALEFPVEGVWGLGDEFVLAYSTLARRPGMARWDGSAWRPMPWPGELQGLHGVAPDRLYAVGMDGLIARWDGAQWRTVPSPTRGVLSSVFAASPDEIYICGRGGDLLEGSEYGFSRVLVAGPMTGVAKWRERVWVADQAFGLHELVRNALVPVAPALHCTRLLPAGDVLLVIGPEQLAETTDGETFRTLEHYAFEDAVAGLWLPDPPGR